MGYIYPMSVEKNDLKMDREFAIEKLTELLELSAKHQIKKLREEMGMTQSQLAETAGMKQPLISKMENPKYDLSLTSLKEVAAAMDCVIEIKLVPRERAIDMVDKLENGE